MKRLVRLGIRSCLLTGIFLGVISLFTGCLKENINGCVRETFLYISVKPEWDGGFIPAEGAAVYLFDKNDRFIKQIQVDAKQILIIAIPVRPEGTNRVVI